MRFFTIPDILDAVSCFVTGHMWITKSDGSTVCDACGAIK